MKANTLDTKPHLRSRLAKRLVLARFEVSSWYIDRLLPEGVATTACGVAEPPERSHCAVAQQTGPA